MQLNWILIKHTVVDYGSNFPSVFFPTEDILFNLIFILIYFADSKGDNLHVIGPHSSWLEVLVRDKNL